MEKELALRLYKFEEEMNWSGIDPPELLEVTEWTLSAMRAWLQECHGYATNDIKLLDETINFVQSHQ